MIDSRYLLDDEAMRRFIVDGFVSVNTDLLRSHHDDIHRRLEQLQETHGALGNNVLPFVPEIGQVLDDPAVRGALVSILGEEYTMHSHRYCHANQPGSSGQSMHKDSYEGDEQLRHHRCRWAMAFYYPHDVTLDMGPTSVLPASQYYETETSANLRPEHPLVGEAGTVVVVHYDLWHRAMPNESDQDRYMIKFLFTRLEEPRRPAWNCQSEHWISHTGVYADELDEVWCSVWDWNCGRSPEKMSGSGDLGEGTEKLLAALSDDDETRRLQSAYALSACGSGVVKPLVDTLDDSAEDGAHPATYALSAVGAAAREELITTLQHASPSRRACAAYALGDIPGSDAAVAPLTRVLGDESPWVRRNAAEAIGALAKPAADTVPALAGLLSDDLEWVRDNAARALAKIGPPAEASVPALASSLRDDSRYVRFHAGLALQRIGTDAARNHLLTELTTARWCPLTSDESPY